MKKLDADHVKAQIRDTFLHVEFPGNWCLQRSSEGDEPFRVSQAFADKRDWQTLEPSFIDRVPDGLASALSFFSDEAFHFYLPAYLIADMDGKLEQADPLFHLCHGLSDSSKNDQINPRRYGERTWFQHAIHKFSIFSQTESKAIVAYLRWKRESDESERQMIDSALKNYWLDRAGEHAD